MAVETRTFADLQAVLSTLLDEASAAFFTTNDRKRAINNAYVMLYNQVVAVGDGEGPAVRVTTLTLTDDDDTITLPSDFFRVVNLYYKDDESTRFQWEKIDVLERIRKSEEVERSSKQKYYFIRETTDATEDNRRELVVIPTPESTVSGKLTLEYIPEPTPLDLDADEPIGIPFPLRELIAYEAYFRLLAKAKMDPPQSTMLVYNRLSEQFARESERRSLQSSRRISGDLENDMY